MASRRMFSRAITGSGRFLRLSAQARALYYDLGMEADDDGFVEAFVRLRATGAEEDHLRELERAGLILILDEDDLVIHIQDWNTNNTLRRDRYSPSVYRAIYPQCVGPEPSDKPEDTQPESVGQPSDNHPAPTGQPSGNQPAATGFFLDVNPATQVRLGKDRLDQDRKAQKNIEKNNSEKKKSEQGRFAEPRARELDPPSEGDFKTAFQEQKFFENKAKSISNLLNSKYFSDQHPSVSHSAFG